LEDKGLWLPTPPPPEDSQNMVSEIEHKGEIIFLCDLCGFGYKERETAEKCEAWCAAYQSCSLEIMKKAVYIPKSVKWVKDSF